MRTNICEERKVLGSAPLSTAYLALLICRGLARKPELPTKDEGR